MSYNFRSIKTSKLFFFVIVNTLDWLSVKYYYGVFEKLNKIVVIVYKNIAEKRKKKDNHTHQSNGKQ